MLKSRAMAPLAASVAVSILAGCSGGGGGGGDAAPPPVSPTGTSPSLTATAEATSTAPDGKPIALHAVVQGTTLTPTWTIASGPGTLSAGSGTDVQYTPPSAEEFDQGATVTVNVSVSGVATRTLTIDLAAADVPGHQWTTFRTSAVHWYGVANGGGLYVAFGDKGRLSTSPDGKTWTARDTGSTDWFTAAARGDDGWLVIGGNHSLLRSADGVVWSDLAANNGVKSPPYSATNLAYGNGRFVTAGYFGSAFATDTATWTVTDTPLASVAFGNGVFVAMTTDFHLVRSTDGATWTRVRDTLVSAADSYHAVAFTNGVFALNDRQGFSTSTDGLTWSAPTGQGLGAVYATADMFFAICPSPLYGDDLCYSGDGTQFYDHSPNNSIDPFIGIAGDATSWVRASNYGSLEWNPQSSDQWQTSLEGAIGDISAIAYANGRYVAVSSVGWAISSADGQAWDSAYTSPFSGHPGEAFSPLVLAQRGDVLVAAGMRTTGIQAAAGEFVVSEDGGLDWTIAADEAAPVRAVIDDGKRFVAVGDAGMVYTSTDGHAWSTLASLSGGPMLSSVAYGLGRYVAVGPNGTLATSPDGAAWTLVTPTADDATVDFATVIFDGQRFVRVANGVGVSEIQTSTDGSTWASQTAPTGPVRGLAFHDGEYVLLDGAGALFTSRDLATWKWRTREFENDVRTVAFCNGRFIAAGANSLILIANQ